MARGATILLILLLISTPASAYDDFGEFYEPFQFVTGAVGPFFFLGDLNNLYKTGAFAAAKVGVTVTDQFLFAPQVGVGVASPKAANSPEKIFSDLALKARFNAVPSKQKIVPYIESGFGFLLIEDVDFEWIVGGGVDFKVWQSGGFGLQATYQQFLSDAGSKALPILVTFSENF